MQLATANRAPSLAHGHGTAFSSSTVDHLGGWADELLELLGAAPVRLVVDVAGGSGHLLAPFRAAGHRVAAIEADPTQAGALVASGIPTRSGEIDSDSAASLRAEVGPADLILVSHALAHLDDLSDAVAALAGLLKPDGAIAIEFHHVLGLVTDGQFDAVAHAHRTYLSLMALRPLLARHGLQAVDARRTSAHGGSVRVLAVPASDPAGRSTPDGASRVDAIVAEEGRVGLGELRGFDRLGPAASTAFARVRSFLETSRADGLEVVGYGAPGRAATLCNTARITPALIPFTVDRSPQKQGRALPGCRIPIRNPAAIYEQRPDLILVLPWTLRDEIVAQLSGARSWGARFAVPLPDVRLLS